MIDENYRPVLTAAVRTPMSIFLTDLKGLFLKIIVYRRYLSAV